MISREDLVSIVRSKSSAGLHRLTFHMISCLRAIYRMVSQVYIYSNLSGSAQTNA